MFFLLIGLRPNAKLGSPCLHELKCDGFVPVNRSFFNHLYPRLIWPFFDVIICLFHGLKISTHFGCLVCLVGIFFYHLSREFFCTSYCFVNASYLFEKSSWSWAVLAFSLTIEAATLLISSILAWRSAISASSSSVQLSVPIIARVSSMTCFLSHITRLYALILCVYYKISFLNRFSRVCRTISTFYFSFCISCTFFSISFRNFFNAL